MQRSSIEDTAVIPIDHQVGANTWASTTPLALLQRNVIILAKFAKGTGMPLVLTSSQETNVKCAGAADARAGSDCAQGVRRSHQAHRCRQRLGRRGVCGRLSQDWPAQLRDGRGDHRRVHGVARDQRAGGRLSRAGGVRRCGSGNPIAEEMSWQRMERAGVRLTSTNAIVAELVRNRASPAGAVAFPLLTT
jgi:hypothetical protein